MALPYPTKVVLPFDIATAQDMNERHANDVALAGGTGINDGAITSGKLGDGAVTAGKLDSAMFGHSTSEVNTGLKYLGDKDIYRRTFTGTLTVGANVLQQTIVGTVAGLTKIIRADGFYDIGTSTISQVIPGFYETNRYSAVSARVDNGDIRLHTRSDQSRTNEAYELTVWYTKA